MIVILIVAHSRHWLWVSPAGIRDYTITRSPITTETFKTWDLRSPSRPCGLRQKVVPVDVDLEEPPAEPRGRLAEIDSEIRTVSRNQCLTLEQRREKMSELQDRNASSAMSKVLVELLQARSELLYLWRFR
jgi:hypothetical protein